MKYWLTLVLIGICSISIAWGEENPASQEDVKQSVEDFMKSLEQSPTEENETNKNTSLNLTPEELVKILKQEAIAEDVWSQWNLGYKYEKGEGVKQNFEKAIYWYTKAAEQNNILSQYSLGEFYLEGKVVPKNIEKAIYWYKQAAKQNDADAQFELGLIYYDDDHTLTNKAKAFYWLERAANKNKKMAQAIIGEMYKEGIGVEKSEYFSKFWLKQVANSHGIYRTALCQLAELYTSENSSLDENEKALDIYTELLNTEESENTRCYIEGKSAYQVKLGKIYSNETELNNVKLAAEWYTKAASNNNKHGQFFLATAYWEGMGVNLNKEKAIYWYQKSADNGFYPAKMILSPTYVLLGNQYLKGDGVIQNYLEAKKWFLKAAEDKNNPNQSAQFKLGWMNTHGYGAPKNYSNALYWYSKVANRGDTSAQYNLGVLYNKGGFGISKNYVHAHKWLNIAQANGETKAKGFLKHLETKMTAAQINEAQRLASSWKVQE